MLFIPPSWKGSPASKQQFKQTSQLKGQTEHLNEGVLTKIQVSHFCSYTLHLPCLVGFQHKCITVNERQMKLYLLVINQMNVRYLYCSKTRQSSFYIKLFYFFIMKWNMILDRLRYHNTVLLISCIGCSVSYFLTRHLSFCSSPPSHIQTSADSLVSQPQ